MDHLPNLSSCRPQAMTVTYLGWPPKYDRKGFDHFPERHGIEAKTLLNYDQTSEALPSDGTVPFRAYAESLLQEWLWFGLIHDIEMAFEIATNPDDFIKPGLTNSHHSSIITTEALLDYVGAATIHRLEKRGVPLNLKFGDLVHVKKPKERHGPRDLRVGPFSIAEDLGRLT